MVEAGEWCLFSCGKGHSDLGAVHKYVLRYVCFIGGDGEVSPRVPVAEADEKVGDRDHQDFY